MFDYHNMSHSKFYDCIMFSCSFTAGLIINPLQEYNKWIWIYILI